MKRTVRGFTIVELMVVIGIIGVLTTLGFISFNSIQSNVRDSQRASRVKIISEALEKYYDKIVSSDVYLKVENTSDKENKIVEIKIHVPGDDFLVKKQCKTFEEAVEQSIESLERLLIKRKEKVKSNI